MTELVVLSPEQREELMLVETQIKQKLAIGATASKRHLVEDLARLGVKQVGRDARAHVDVSAGEVQERAEGRRVTKCTEGSKRIGRRMGRGWRGGRRRLASTESDPSRPGARRGWFCRPSFM